MAWSVGDALAVSAAVIGAIFYLARLEMRLRSLEKESKRTDKQLSQIQRAIGIIYYRWFGRPLPDHNGDIDDEEEELGLSSR